MISTIFQHDQPQHCLSTENLGVFERLFSVDYCNDNRPEENEFYLEFCLEEKLPVPTCTFKVETESTCKPGSRKGSAYQSTQDEQHPDNCSTRESELGSGTKFSSESCISAKRSELPGLVCKLLDRKPVKLAEVLPMDNETLLIFSNFTKLLFQFEIVKTSPIQNQIESLNDLIRTTKDKKKRNEERIKYTFKRVNKMLLKRFASGSRESESETEKIQSNLVAHYFSSTTSDKSKVSNMLFRPTNLYRNDLKSLFSHNLYKQEFSSILENTYIEEFMDKRLSTLEGYIRMLKEEIYYAGEAGDCNLLSKKLTRMPWSIQEVQRGVEVLQDILRNP
jgi:hypothetical protein